MAAYHGLIPDDRHALLGAIGALWDQGEVVLPDSLLGSVESAVGTASHLQVSAARKTQAVTVNRQSRVHFFSVPGL